LNNSKGYLNELVDLAAKYFIWMDDIRGINNKTTGTTGEI
jgi:hypothetical protein